MLNLLYREGDCGIVCGYITTRKTQKIKVENSLNFGKGTSFWNLELFYWRT